MSNMEALRTRWTELVSNHLPAAAIANDSNQITWPVHTENGFSRIILDNIVGEARKPWMRVLKAPAIKHMDENQLLDCISLAEEIFNGAADLSELNHVSLAARGKSDTTCKPLLNSGQKRKTGAMAESPSPKKAKVGKKQTGLSFKSKFEDGTQSRDIMSEDSKDEDHTPLLNKIARDPKLTQYQKRLYSTLLSVPRGRYTTYSAMSEYLQSSARAVGNGMRSNPFAPDVPCHRVLAADGTLGGYKGDWGKDGKHSNQKIDLLKQEGVQFDSRGKVVGFPFREFMDLSAM